MKYKKLMKVLLTELYTRENPDFEFIEQIILRYALSSKFVISDGINFILTKKGSSLIRGENGTKKSYKYEQTKSSLQMEDTNQNL